MKMLIAFLGWCILLVLSWPLALLALILFPLVWLVMLPFRLVEIAFEALFALVRTILLFAGAHIRLAKDGVGESGDCRGACAKRLSCSVRRLTQTHAIT